MPCPSTMGDNSWHSCVWWNIFCTTCPLMLSKWLSQLLRWLPSIHCNKLRAYRSLIWYYCITQSTNSARWSYHELIWKCQPQYCSELVLEQPLREDLYSHDIAHSTSISNYYRKCEDEKKRTHICYIKHSLFTLLVFVPQGEWPKATVTIYFM